MGPDSIAVPDGSQPPDRQLPLIRYSHIFTAAVREFLEGKLLREASDGKVTPRQLQLLRFIGVAHHHVDDIAKFLGITGPAATKAVDRLERAGYIVRTASGDDRRLKLLSCSESGQRLVSHYRSMEEDLLGSVLQHFEDDELAALGRLLQRYALALIATGAADNEPCLRCSGWFDADCAVQAVRPNCPYRHSLEESR